MMGKGLLNSSMVLSLQFHAPQTLIVFLDPTKDTLILFYFFYFFNDDMIRFSVSCCLFFVEIGTVRYFVDATFRLLHILSTVYCFQRTQEYSTVIIKIIADTQCAHTRLF